MRKCTDLLCKPPSYQQQYQLDELQWMNMGSSTCQTATVIHMYEVDMCALTFCVLNSCLTLLPLFPILHSAFGLFILVLIVGTVQWILITGLWICGICTLCTWILILSRSQLHYILILLALEEIRNYPSYVSVSTFCKEREF